jgi:hypothetical protein
LFVSAACLKGLAPAYTLMVLPEDFSQTWLILSSNTAKAEDEAKMNGNIKIISQLRVFVMFIFLKLSIY